MMPPLWIGLTVALASALVTNTAYSLEHDAAAALPPLSPRHPLASVRLLLGDRRWLLAFAAETAGWLMYVAALRLAPLSLVQAVAASGVAVLAFATARGHPSRLARHEQAAAVLAVAGLVLLAFSLVGTSESDQRPAGLGVVTWLAACGGGAALLIGIPTRLGRAASLGLAAGLLFADGDVSAKLVGYGGGWLAATGALIVAYATGTSVLQWAYQRGDALTAAGMATMATNAVPIAAGFVLFGEDLPHGTRAALQVTAFACLVVSAIALGRRQAPEAGQRTPRADRPGEGTAEGSGQRSSPSLSCSAHACRAARSHQGERRVRRKLPGPSAAPWRTPPRSSRPSRRGGRSCSFPTGAWEPRCEGHHDDGAASATPGRSR